MPIKKPIAKAPPGLNSIPAAAPMTTPPDKVAFKRCSIVNLDLIKALVIKEARQLPVKAKIVFDIICVLVNGVVAPTPKLNDGQNIHKNRVPMNAKMFEV